jgi:hypothetical protein
MAVLALRIPGQSIRPVGLGLLVFVLLAALAAVAYYFGREYINGRRGTGRAQSLRDCVMLGLTILGVVALVGRYCQ